MSKEKIIVALDVPAANEAREIIGELGGAVGAFKIGLQLFVSAGTDFVREIVAGGNRIFLDLKFHDIPNTVASASIEAARLGVWMFNVHAAGGSEMMRRTIETVSETCAKENLSVPKIIAVTVLTSSSDETLREIGVESNSAAQVSRLAKLTYESGLHGIVASPREIETVRGEIGDKDFLIVTPGIRSRESRVESRESKDGKQDDQKRILSAAEAVTAGADYLVIGRPILQAADRRAAVREILADIEKQTSRNSDQN